jgi:hypothetical protein
MVPIEWSMMSRPDSITNEDIIRWSQQINEELPPELSEDVIIREVCLAGMWLVEQLQKLLCPEEVCAQLQHSAGRLSFGRDIWDVHQKMLHGYQTNALIIESDLDPSELN